MLEFVWEKTQEFLETKKKAERKKIGQFFTTIETARFMASLFNIPCGQQISILDPGAGSGILSIALVERIFNEKNTVGSIHLVCYENNPDIYQLLQNNLEYISCSLPPDYLIYEIVTDNYITSQAHDYNQTFLSEPLPRKFDIVIGNPPYKKVLADAPEAKGMSNVCYGAPNLYFLFAAMSLFNLKDNGEMVYILPRSWTSGAYFKAFRKYLLHIGKLLNIHLFISRDSVFGKENVLQETMIIHIKKQKTTPKDIILTSSHNGNDYNHIAKIKAPYSTVVSGENNYVYLITADTEEQLLENLSHFHETLPSLGLRMKTGLAVDFRNRDLLRNNPGKGIVPLFYSQHIQNGLVVFPISKEYEYIDDSKKGLVQRNKNYLFIKRFTAKEEYRRLQCGIYNKATLPEYQMISTQNKINFIDFSNGEEMSLQLVYGLYVILNSSIYDLYYRILNGSTQVNSTEINAAPMPKLDDIINLGIELMGSEDLSTTTCDCILKGIL